MCCKKKGTYIQRTPPPMEKKKRKKKRGAEYRTRELRLDSLMVSPPTLQRHELDSFFTLPFCTPRVAACDNNSVLTTPLKPRLLAVHTTHDTRHTHRFFFGMQQLETRFARIIYMYICVSSARVPATREQQKATPEK